MNRSKKRLDEYASMIEESLQSYIPIQPHPESLVCDAMKYSLLSGGKRIRGALTLAFYHLYKEDVNPVLPFAGAMEMVHAYSLIHDDLPCMDNDDMRRGKPSCHIAFGEANALLAGDGLLTLAFQVMTDPQYSQAFSADKIVKAVQCLSAAAGCAGMIGGQVIDLFQEGKDFSEELLVRTNKKKTGALITASAQLGCILAGANETELTAASTYCNHIGQAFQIVDDILDVTGDQEKLGKPIGSDAENQKQTFVHACGLDAAKQKVTALNEKAKQALHVLPGDTTFLMELADMLAGREK